MKIVITDGYTVNPGDLNWEAIAAFGELVIYERTSSNQIVERCTEASIILTNKVPIDRNSILQLPFLKLINVTATGYNVVDITAAKEKNIVVCNVPAYGTSSVAQHSIALLLELANHVGLHANSVAAGEWQRSVDWSYAKTSLIELDGKTLGIIGYGNIGQRTASIARSMGMKIIYNSTTPKKNDPAQFRNLESSFAESDFISLHCPLKTDNAGFVNQKMIDLMKPSAFLINTARGQLINERDLADALNSGRIAGAALDVLSTEPPSEDNPLLSARNCIITPHNAWKSREARQRILDITASNIAAFLKNNPVNVVN
jgi:glycerate dehydrogenase